MICSKLTTFLILETKRDTYTIITVKVVSHSWELRTPYVRNPYQPYTKTYHGYFVRLQIVTHQIKDRANLVRLIRKQQKSVVFRVTRSLAALESVIQFCVGK